MPLRRKPADPIDRAIGDLDRQIATLQREMRETGMQPPRGHEPAESATTAHSLARFIKDALAPSRRSVDSSARAREDLFDIDCEPLKDLEAEPISFAGRSEPDLFTRAPGAAAASATASESAQIVPRHEKLAQYLGAGSIKSYKPLKHVQRKIRNRFFMWVGLSFVALWIIWFVIR
jgi:hypothetical protein